MSMEDILKVLVDSRQQGNAPQQGADPMTSLIGGLLGGATQQGGTSQQGGDAMTSLIGGLLGGVQPQTQSGVGHAPTPPSGYTTQQYPSQGGNQSGAGLGDLMGLLETFMNGQGGSSAGNDPIMALLSPFVAPLAKKANISPDVAMVVISFVVHKLLAHHPTSGRDSNSFNLDTMLQQMGSGQVDTSVLRSSGMVNELSQKTGLDNAQTEQALQMAFSLVGKTVSNMASQGSSKPSSAGAMPKSASKPSAKK